MDGRPSYAALLELASEDEGWHAFQWPATLPSGGNSLNVLKQVARCRSARNSDRCFVRTTLSDALNGLKEQYARLLSQEVRLDFAVQVYCTLGTASNICLKVR